MTANALETLFALNALAHPERRPFLSAWAADVQARLTAGERDWLAELRKLPELFQVETSSSGGSAFTTSAR
jgi:hypothetical protein